MIVTQSDFHLNPFSAFRHTPSRKSPLLWVILLCPELLPFIFIILMSHPLVMHLIIHMFNTSMIPYISLDQYLNPNLYTIPNMQNMRFFCCPVYYVKSGFTNVLKNANKTKNMHLFSIRIANYRKFFNIREPPFSTVGVLKNVHSRMHVCTHAHAAKCSYTHACTHTYVCMHAQLHMHMDAYIYTFTT